MAKDHIQNLEPIIQKVKEKLEKNLFMITHEQQISYGYQLRLSQGSIVNIYSTGAIAVQGKKDTEVNLLLGLK